MKPRSLLRLASSVALAFASCSFALLAQSDPAIRFERQVLSTEFLCEGANLGDLDRDGHLDVIAGPYWWRGPEFVERYTFRAVQVFDVAQYSDKFFVFVHDFDGDGWDDVLSVGFPGRAATWHRNPGEPTRAEHAVWPEHLAFAQVDNESPWFVDLTGDGVRELVCQTGGRLGYAAPDPTAPTEPFVWHPISVEGVGHAFTHGLGVGDVDGDGRLDVLWKFGWWQQPESLLEDPVWEHHGVLFAHRGGAQMFAHDVDGDGHADVITSEDAHGHGLVWFEAQRESAASSIEFERHAIMSADPTEFAHGVAVGNLHALALADVDADGDLDIVTGNRYWAHGGRDVADREPPTLYWFERQQTTSAQPTVQFVPRLIDADSGVGTQVVAQDADGDGDVDVIVANKRGVFVMRALPNVAPTVSVGRRPVVDGRELNLDFETGDLTDWRIEGEAFAGMPIRGDVVRQRRSDASSGHSGEFWVGSFERLGSDAPRGTLTSRAFVVDAPFATMLVGGGHARRGVYVELVRARDDAVVSRVGGLDDEHMQRVLVDLAPHRGESCFLRLVDTADGHWGHLNFDDFLLHDQRPQGPLRDPIWQQDAPLTAADARSRMRLPADFSITTFAAEPDVHQPIALSIDAAGRVWVAEAHSYPVPRGEGQGEDRIVVFEDLDDDGRFDRRSVFLDSLDLVSGLEVGHGGVWIGAAPYLLFVPDADRDLVPDGPAQIVLDGFGRQDTHETLNSFRFGPDGWLYGCHGVFTHSNVGPPGTPDAQRVRINAGVWRVHPRTREFEVFAHGTSNPWGIDFDARGEAFVTACVIPHAFHIVSGGRYQRQTGQHFEPHTYADIGTIADHLHYVGATPWSGNYGSDAVGGGHAHAGAMIYRGGAFPAEFRGCLFMNNVHGHRVLFDTLDPQGSGYVARHGGTFLRADDQWFMGIDLRYGPRGSVFLIDWYDDQTCHTNKVAAIERGNGRIYEIRHAAAPPHERFDLVRADEDRLVELLFADNHWYGDTAQRLLQERRTIREPTRARLRKIARTSPDEYHRLRATWTLHVVAPGIDDELARELLTASPFPSQRGTVVQMLFEDRSVSAAIGELLVERAANEPSAVVRLDLASALQRAPAELAWRLAERLVRHAADADDPNLPCLLWYGIEPLLASDPQRAMALAADCALPFVARSCVRRLAALGALGVEAVLRSFAAGAEPRENRARRASDFDWWRDCLRELDVGLEGRPPLAAPPAWAAVFATARDAGRIDLLDAALTIAVRFGDPAAIDVSRAVAADRDASADRRRAAFERVLDFVSRPAVEAVAHDDAVAWVVALLDDGVLGESAARALARFDDDGVPPVLLARSRDASPTALRAIVTTLAAREPWSLQLLDAIEGGAIPRDVLDAPLRARLGGLGSATVDARLARLFGRSREVPKAVRARIDELVERHTEQFLAAGDRTVGRDLFMRTCGACHELFGAGGSLGPGLTGSHRRDLRYLFGNILDPDAEVATESMLTTVRLHSGEVLAGFVTEREGGALAIRSVDGANDSLRVVTAAEVAAVVRHETSLMPAGQLDVFDEAQVRDLIAYLVGDEQVPWRVTPLSAVQLFDGETLRHWRADPAVWSVEGGEIVGRSEGGLPHNSFAISELLYGDFELELQVRLASDRGNSGIQFRSRAQADGDVAGLQADIGPGWWGKLYEEHGRGLLVGEDREAVVRRDDWNDYKIVAVGDRVQTWLNGTPCVDRVDPAMSREGVIALQVHSGGPTEVRFRNLRVTLR